MKIFLLFIIFSNLSYGASSRNVHFSPEFDPSRTPDRQSLHTRSTASHSAGVVDFMLNIWQNILNDGQRKLFSSKFSSSTNHWDVLKAFYSQYNEAKKTVGGDDATPFDVLSKMELFMEPSASPARSLRHPEPSDSDDDEDTSDAHLKSLWAFIEETPHGQLITAIDASSAFSLFCHLYDASFNALTVEDDADNVNGFMVIENMITTEIPPKIKDSLLAQALLALRNAEREGPARDKPGISPLSVASPAGPPVVGVAAPAPSSVHQRDPEPDSDAMKEPLLGPKDKESGCCCVIS